MHGEDHESATTAILGLLFLLFQILEGSSLFALTPDGGKAFKEALEFQKSGKSDDAARSYEKAIRMDPSVLSENSQGLGKTLHDYYQKRVNDHPSDPEALEGMGFIFGSCDADFAKAAEYYGKAMEKTSDEAGRKRLSALIDSCKAQLGSAPAPSSSGRSPTPSPSEGSPEENASESADPEAAAKKEKRISEFNTKKEGNESRISQLEEEIKGLEEENKKSHRLYSTTNDRRYKRQEDERERTMSSKQREIDKLRNENQRIDSAIDQVSQGDLDATVEEAGTEEPEAVYEPEPEPEDGTGEEPREGTPPEEPPAD